MKNKEPILTIDSTNHLKLTLRNLLINMEASPYTGGLTAFGLAYDHYFPPKTEWHASMVEFTAYVDTMAELVVNAHNVPEFGTDWSNFFVHLDWANIFYLTQNQYKYLCASRLGCRVSGILDSLLQPRYCCEPTESDSAISPTPYRRAAIDPHYSSSNSNDVDDLMYD